MKYEHPMFALLIRAIVAFPLFVLLIIFLDEQFTIAYYWEQFPLIILLVITIIWGDGMFLLGLKYYPVNIVLPIASIYPLFTTIILLLLGSEQISFYIGFGTILVVTGVYLVTSKGKLGIQVPPRAILFGILTALGWGSSVVVSKYLLISEGISSLGLMGFRTIFIGAFGALIFMRKASNLSEYKSRPRAEKIRAVKYLGLSGIFGWVFGATLLFVALENILAAVATPITSANPVIAVLIGEITGWEKLNTIQFLGILTSTIGVIILIF